MIEEDRLRVEIIGYKDTIDRLLSQLTEKDKQIKKMKKCPICEYNYDFAEPCSGCKDYSNWKMSSKWELDEE